MNKADIKLCLFILAVSLIIYCVMLLTSSNSANKKAVVYYDSKEVLSIDLNEKDTQNYTVKGYNGDVNIEISDGKVRVIEENSPRHLCSKQGWIKESYESIICLPNKVVINIVSKDDLDTIVR